MLRCESKAQNQKPQTRRTRKWLETDTSDCTAHLGTSYFTFLLMWKVWKGKARRAGSEPARRMIKLFCWILDKTESPFSVNIANNDTIDDLKDAIFKKNPITLASVDAHQLALWKVSHFFQL